MNRTMSFREDSTKAQDFMSTPISILVKRGWANVGTTSWWVERWTSFWSGVGELLLGIVSFIGILIGLGLALLVAIAIIKVAWAIVFD
jgi:hypothetical protein